MPVIRVHKTRDYTVMSNAHFREKEMTLKAKGLHSLMLSLPEDWDYSIAGLTTLSKDGKDSVMSALNELERFGYLQRTRVTDEKGKFAGYDYDIFEQPQAENPYAENPNTDKPNTENPPQYITNQSITKKSNTNVIEIKKERKVKATNSFDILIENYLETINPFEVDEVRGLLQEWLKVRKAKRAAMTDKAIELNLQKLNEIAGASNLSVAEYLKAVIMRGWQAFYEIIDYSQGQQSSGVEKRGITDEMRDIYDYYQQEAEGNANR